MAYTPEDIAKRFNGEDPDDVGRMLKDFTDEAKDYKNKERGELKKFRGFVNESEKDGAGTKPNGDWINTRLPKMIVDLVKNAAFEQPINVEVRAQSLPQLEPSLVKDLQGLAQVLGVRSQGVAELVSSLRTHELHNYFRDLNLNELGKEALEYALIDRWAAIKTTIDPLSPTKQVCEVVTLDCFTADPHATTWEKQMWKNHDILISAEEFAAKYPHVVESMQARGWFANALDFVAMAWKRFLNTDDEGPIHADTAKKDSKFKRLRLKEWWVRNFTTEQLPAKGPDGQPLVDPATMQPVLMPPTYKYPGTWMRIYTFNGEVLSVETNPYPHLRDPFKPIVPKSKLGDWRGSSFIYDLHDLIVNLDKGVSMAMFNLIESCNNLMVWNPNAFENPEELRSKRPGMRELILKPNFTMDMALKQLQGPGVNQGIFQVYNLIEGMLMRVSGTGVAAQKLEGQDGEKPAGDANMGFTIAGVLSGIKTMYEGVGYDLMYNSVEYVNQKQDYALIGEDTVTFSWNPANLRNYMNQAKFRVEAVQTERLPSEPGARDDAMGKRMTQAAEMTKMTGIPLSTTIGITKPPDHAILKRIIVRREIEAEQGGKQTEKSEVRENSIVDSLVETAKNAYKTLSDDPTNAAKIAQQFETGALRQIFDLGVNGPQAAVPEQGKQSPVPVPAGTVVQ